MIISLITLPYYELYSHIMIDRAIINRDMWAFTYLAAVSCLNVHMLPITLKENVNIKIKSSTESLFSKIRPCVVPCCAAEVWYHFSASIYQDYIASPVGSFLWIGLKWDEIHHKTLFLHAKSSRKPVKCEETHTHTLLTHVQRFYMKSSRKHVLQRNYMSRSSNGQLWKWNE